MNKPKFYIGDIIQPKKPYYFIEDGIYHFIKIGGTYNGIMTDRIFFFCCEDQYSRGKRFRLWADASKVEYLKNKDFI